LESSIDLIKLIESKAFKLVNEKEIPVADPNSANETEEGADEESESEHGPSVKKQKKTKKGQHSNASSALSPESCDSCYATCIIQCLTIVLCFRQEFIPYLREALQLLNSLASLNCKFPEAIVVSIVQCALDGFFADVAVDLQLVAMDILRTVRFPSPFPFSVFFPFPFPNHFALLGIYQVRLTSLNDHGRCRAIYCPITKG